MLLQDYHVVLLQVSPGAEPLVYDLDSNLSFPCSLRKYGAEALRSDLHIKTPYHRYRTHTGGSNIIEFMLVLARGSDITVVLPALTGSCERCRPTASCPTLPLIAPT